jgi:hypothetical protein
MSLRRSLWFLLPALAACADETPTESLGNRFLPCAFRSESRMGVGEVRQFRGAQGQLLCLSAAEGAEYTFVPFYASATDTTFLNFSVVGGNLQGVSGPPNPALLPSFSLDGVSEPEARVPDPEFHLRLQERARRELGPLGRAGSGPRAALAPSQPASAAAVPQVGDRLQLNVSLRFCAPTEFRTARVMAVTQRAIVVADTTNPPGGFTEADYRAFGETFDNLVYDVDTRNFGAPTDIDANGGRSIIFFTRRVNELTPPGSRGFVGGFFYVRDLLARQPSEQRRAGLPLCPGSNHAEMFYLLAPDPTGAVNGNVFPTDFVRRITVGTIAHEFEHLISFSRRLYVNNATEFEEVWLEEGMAHIAEELVFYQASGLAPRQNISLETLRSSPRVLSAVNTYQISNLARYRIYLEEPDSNSLIGEDELPTRGAGWAFLRYAADREPGPDQNFFFSLVNSNASGVENLRQALKVDPIDWMQDWTLSVYTDDAPTGPGQVLPVEPQYTQPSWNFRSVIPAITREQRFPLAVRALTSGSERGVALRAGGAAFLRFGIAGGGRVALGATSRNNAAPPERLRFSIVRTK